MNKYQQGKERAREKAQELFWEFAQKDHYASECVDMWEYLHRIGKRYGLLKEFRENGIC